MTDEPKEAPKGAPPPPPTLTSFLALAEETARVLGPAATTATSGSVPAWRVGAADLRDAARRLREAGWDYLLFMTAVDYPKEERFEMVYLLARFADSRHMALVADVPRGAPEIDSVCDVWAAADWHEREAYDMFGIVFRGHPFLRRILLDEDWPGHPLRKDYQDTLHDVVKRPY
jgi:NADH/F420H2 dehydrogenase subunit C